MAYFVGDKLVLKGSIDNKNQPPIDNDGNLGDRISFRLCQSHTVFDHDNNDSLCCYSSCLQS